MWKKTPYLFVIILAFYVSIMVNHPSEKLKRLGYNYFLDFYAELVSSRAPVDIIYDPGLRKLDCSLEKAVVRVFMPGDADYEDSLNEILMDRPEVIVECSGADTWHTTERGRNFLTKLRARSYRAVVFDGGHHLPTLGLMPDIIIIPQLKGYAVHSYMLDGIEVDKIQALAEEVNSPSVIAAVPRWALVKNARSLDIITRKILVSSHYADMYPETFRPETRPRMSKYGGLIFAYVGKEYCRNIDLFLEQLNSLGTGGINKICLAFDYSFINQEEAGVFAAAVSEKLRLPVEKVNRPVKVFNVFWGENNVLLQPGDNN